MALRRPTTPTSYGQDLQVALKAGSSFDYDWEQSDLGRRIRVESVTNEVIGRQRFPRAELSVNLCGEYDDDQNEIMPPIRIGQLQRIIGDTVRLVVHDGSPSADREFLFDGYAKIERPRIVGTPGAENLSMPIVCTSVTERMAGEKDAWIYGRHIEISTTEARFVAAMPCIFNHGGKPNRSKDLIDVDGTDVPFFTYDGDPNAKYWTYADVLTYLVCKYLWALPDTYPVQDGNGVDRCSSIVEADEGPKELTNTDNPNWGQVVSQKCPEMSCEGMDIVSALQLWCEYAGCEMMQHTFNDGSGDPQTVLLFSVGGDGGPFDSSGAAILDATSSPASARPLQLEAEGASIAGRTPASVLANNEVEQLDLLIDYHNIVQSFRVIGDAQYFEVTIGKAGTADIMKPGWVADTMFGDNLTGSGLEDKCDEISAATDPEADGNAGTMFGRYDRRGVNFYNYTSVGRLWVANESGEYSGASGATYGRTGAQATPWAAAIYATPYDFHTACSVPKLTGDVEWIRRRRPISKLLSKGPGNTDRPPIVQCSWDSGTHWYTYPGTISFLGTQDKTEAQCAVYLADQNLAEVKNDKAAADDANADMSVWEAIARGTFRIALTCTVQGDGRVMGTAGSDTKPHVDIHMPNAIQYANRTAGNSMLKTATGWTCTDVDETEAAKSYAARKLLLNKSRRISGTAIIPWLTKDWAPGDLCSGIMPCGLDFGELTGSTSKYPRVAKVHWVNSESGQETHITLGDSRTEIRMVDGQGQTLAERGRRRA